MSCHVMQSHVICHVILCNIMIGSAGTQAPSRSNGIAGVVNGERFMLAAPRANLTIPVRNVTAARSTL